jgi:hypothetical protein
LMLVFFLWPIDKVFLAVIKIIDNAIHIWRHLQE